MNKFAQAIIGDSHDIKFTDAADFFLSIKRGPEGDGSKTAGLLDPPDETGELEGKFEVPVENVVALMQNAITQAMTLMQAAMLYESSVRGPLMSPVRCVLSQNWDHRCVIEYLTKRATTLAGPVHLGELEIPPASSNPIEIAKRMIRGEQEFIAALREVLLVVGENPMKTSIQGFMSSAQNRIDDYWRSLDPVAPAPTEPAPPVELSAHEALETPEDEGTETPEFQAAEQAAGTEQHAPALEGAPKTASVRSAPKSAAAGAFRKAASAVGVLPKRTAREIFKLAYMGMSEGAGDPEAPMSSPTAGGELEPTNYLQAELEGRKAQEQGEAAYYRQQTQQVTQQVQQQEQQLTEFQTQLEQLQAQAGEAQAAIQQNQQQAMAANDEALRQSQIAANMRMGMQQMRSQIMQVASQDPAANAAAELQSPATGAPVDPTQQATAVADAQLSGQPPAQEGPAAAAPGAEAAPTAAPPGGGLPAADTPAQAPAEGNGGLDMASASPTSATKIGSVLESMKQKLPGILAGGAAGGTLGYGYGRSLGGKAPGLRDKVQAMEADGSKGFLGAMNLAAKKGQLLEAELAEKHPGASTAYQVGRGALAGAMAGPVIHENVKSLLTP